MGENTKIEWATHTFNPYRGCTKVSPGCANCYAESLSHRNPGTLGVWGPNGTRVVAAESYWRQPLKWNRQAERDGVRRRVFCASLSDVFEDWWGDVVNHKGEGVLANQWYPPLGRGSGDRLTMSHVRERLGDVIRQTPHLDWLLLTKRPENVLHMAEDHMFGLPLRGDPLLPPNVWIGTSVEDQQRANERIPVLLSIPAAVRFLSMEPLLGPVDLSRDETVQRCLACGAMTPTTELPGGTDFECGACGDPRTRERSFIDGIDWVIVGGESGPHARPMHPDWARSIRDQCQAAGVPFHFKQHGEWTARSPLMPLPGGREVPRACVGVRWEPGMPDGEANEVIVYRVGKKAAGRTLDGRTWDELPTQ